jgi:hypothetical protein
MPVAPARTPLDKLPRTIARLVEPFLLAAILALFAAAVIGPSVGLPFIGDDYVFLDKTRAASFATLWSPTRSVAFGWYRPWSREVHFWVLQRLVGLDAAAYRGFNVVLWIVALCLYAAIVSRLASRKTAAIATLGVAGLAFWGTPLSWASGSQDLWMLALSMLCLLLFVRGHSAWAVIPFVLALLSKEAAAVLPALLCAYVLILRRHPFAQAMRETWLFWCVLATWAIAHPTLRLRLLGLYPSTQELTYRLPWHIAILRGVTSSINLDLIPHPQEIDAGVVCRVLLTCLLLVGGLIFAEQRHKAEALKSNRMTLTQLAGTWALIGWCPLLLPSIGWHAYYGCVGALGLWLGLAVWLQSRPITAGIILAVIGLLRGAQANTLSADWGDASYFRRAGSALRIIHDDVMRQHPRVSPFSRMYFANIPYNIGLIAGDGPTLRVWYGDSSLESGYYSQYRPRTESAPRGADYFFRFDSTAGMVEVRAGEEDVRSAIRDNPKWEEDHDGLAGLFLEKGDLRRAAVELAKLSQLRHRPDAAVYAGVCWRLAGDGRKADSLLRSGAARLHVSDRVMGNIVDGVAREIRRRRQQDEAAH